MKEVSSAFLKKSAQKTFATFDRAGENTWGPVKKKFFASFFQKRSASFYLVCFS
jgi:hypothetical protein